MGRKVRRVPADWVHPRYSDGGEYIPLHNVGYSDAATKFLRVVAEQGLQAAVDYFGSAPDKRCYMPDWPESERTHYMMYETTPEGTPISPAFATPEELARWLADNGANAGGGATATYEAWLRVCRGGYAPSAVILPETGFVNGVQGMHTLDARAADSE